MRHSFVKMLALGVAGTLLPLAVAQAQAQELRTLRVIVDKAEVVKVDGSASVVLVANPQIADVVVERNHLVFVVGRRPGETRLYVYSASGKALLEREIVVVPQGDRTVTITRDVQPTSYSCDPRCTAVGQRPGAGSTATIGGALAPASTPAAPAPGPTASAH
jgi:Flp pilus assembly secretin CpaC